MEPVQQQPENPQTATANIQKVEPTQQQLENQQLLQNPADVQTVELEEPILMGNIRISSIDIRKPSVHALKGIRVADILNGDVSSICSLLPKVSTPALTQAQVNELEPADIVQLGAAIIYFLQPKSVRAELSLQQ